MVLNVLAAITGLCAGSFINVVAFRLPVALLSGKLPNLTGPRSACPHCRKTIVWYDNIPVLSWCMLKARCRDCQSPISIRYPLTELVSGLTFLLLSYTLPADYALLPSALFCVLLITLVQTDIRYKLLPDLLTYTLMWVGLLSSAGGIIPVDLPYAVTGAALGYLTLWLIRAVFHRIKKQEGLGLGDAKLLAALGAWTGPDQLPHLLLMASAGGLMFVLLARITTGRDLRAALPFGPFLSLSGAIIYFFTLTDYFSG